MRIVCWQTILMKYYTIFFSIIMKDVTKFVVCCSHDWRFKVIILILTHLAYRANAKKSVIPNNNVTVLKCEESTHKLVPIATAK